MPETCKHCQVEKHGLVFKTSCDRLNGTTSSPNFVRTRICRDENHPQCLNKSGQIQKELDYNNQRITTEQWLETAKAIAERRFQ